MGSEVSAIVNSTLKVHFVTEGPWIQLVPPTDVSEFKGELHNRFNLISEDRVAFVQTVKTWWKLPEK